MICQRVLLPLVPREESLHRQESGATMAGTPGALKGPGRHTMKSARSEVGVSQYQWESRERQMTRTGTQEDLEAGTADRDGEP